MLELLLALYGVVGLITAYLVLVAPPKPTRTCWEDWVVDFMAAGVFFVGWPFLLAWGFCLYLRDRSE